MRHGWSALRRRLIAVVPVLLVPVAVAGTGTTLAAFTGTTASAGNVVSAKPDWTPPTVTASKIAVSSGKVPGTIRPGATYYVYGNASDAGSPPSGVQTVVTNVSNLTTGAVNVPLVAGSYSVGSTNYAWRSGLLTADAGLVNGAYTYTHQAADFDGNSQNQSGFPVDVDAVPPTAIDVQATNGPGAVNTPDAGDAVTFTFSEPIDPATVSSGWDGSTTSTIVRLRRSGGQVQITFFSGTTQLPLGTLRIPFHYGLGNNATHDFAGSSMVASGNTITFTLGPGALVAGTTPLVMDWTVPATVTDLLGHVITAATVNEGGPLDTEF